MFLFRVGILELLRDALSTLNTLVLVGVVADNALLRRQLRGRRGG